jgi:hypothetical protein
VDTPAYDFAAGGWQDLEAVLAPEAGEAAFMTAAEKGTTSPSGVNAEIAEWTVEAIPVP